MPYKPRNELSLSVVSSRGKRVNWGQYSFLGSYSGDFFWRVVPCCSLCFLAGLSGAFCMLCVCVVAPIPRTFNIFSYFTNQKGKKKKMKPL